MDEFERAINKCDWDKVGEMLGTPPVRQVFYTADLIIPDGSDTGIYGDGTMPGEGSRLESGWYDPDWCRTEVREEKKDVRADIFDPSDGTDPSVWLAHTLNERLNGWTEYNGRGWWSAGEVEESDHRTGISASVAAHAEGFTDAELRQAEDLLQMVRQDGGWAILESLYGGEMVSREVWEDWNR